MSQTHITAEEAKKTTIDKLFRALGTDKEGLSSSEASRRLNETGPNEIPEKKSNPVINFLRYFWGPIPWMIEAAVVMSALIQRWEDFGIILVLLLANGIVGFTRERQAGNAIDLLKEKLALKARVKRDDKWQEIPARELVPGDIIRVRLGDIVPADVKLVDGNYLLSDESTLTGESLPVEKHLSDIAFAGSIARQGEMDGLVVTTGQRTLFGKTTKLVEAAKAQSHFQKAVVKIGDYLILLAIGLVVTLVVIELLRSQPPLQILQFALVLIVAAIPAALPTVLSVTMAIGAIALAAKEAIVSKLVSIEEIAGMDVLCSDKTGTITKNELTVGEIHPLYGCTVDDVLLYSALASREEDKDPIDTAIITKTRESATLTKLLKDIEIEEFKPFDPSSKRTEASVKEKTEKQFKISKGAPQTILALVKDKSDLDDTIDEVVTSFAAKGYRSLGVARTNAQNEWQYVGLIALFDPPRNDSAETIKTAQSMGIQIKMLTGDHLAIAKETARRVGLGTNIQVASSLLEQSKADSIEIIESADGFAEVYPENKYNIVELLQSRDHIVGMTGDGVNDAPALKKANAGIAVAGATDAAKSAASIVLTKPGLSVIIDAVQQSRKIFQRMTSYSIYRISETIRVLFFITATIVAFQVYPVTALMIVLLAILNDLPIITIAYDNVKYSASPEKWNLRRVLGIATFLGTIGVFSSFGLFLIGRDVLKLSPLILQSFIYLKLSVAGHLVLLVARTRGYFWSVRPANILLLAIIGTQLTATLLTVYGILLPAMGWTLAAIVWGYALILFLATDLLKVQFYKFIDRKTIDKH